ncbi:MAG: type 1 glutamine amidotransferase [Acidimicrobiales bacterium]
MPWRQVDVHAGEPLPASVRWRAVVPLGGEMGAYDEDRFGFLVDEKRFLGRAVEAGTPVLGICLGSQLLADALGGRAHRGREPEVGFRTLELTSAGAADAVLGAAEARGPHFLWHHDTFDLPRGAMLLAASDRYPHAYRMGSALALQFHPEAGADIILDWADRAGPDGLAADGLDPDQFRKDVEASAPAARTAGLELFTAWVATI